jgi:hypothetical protein
VFGNESTRLIWKQGVFLSGRKCRSKSRVDPELALQGRRKESGGNFSENAAKLARAFSSTLSSIELLLAWFRIRNVAITNERKGGEEPSVVPSFRTK